MRYQTFINGGWVDQRPTETGQRYRLYDDAGGVLESFWSEPVVDTRKAYQITNESVTANGQTVTKFAGNYYVNSGDTIQLQGTLTDDSVMPDITVPVTLKMPLVRHANGQATQDEIYLNVTLNAGVMTATGLIERSGDWKILTERVNEALQRIGAEWKLDHPDVTFLA